MTRPEDDEGPLPGAGSLDAEGRFERLEPKRERAPEPPGAPEPPAEPDAPQPGAALELGERPEKKKYDEPQPYRDGAERPSRRTGRRVVLAIALSLLAALLVGGWWSVHERSTKPGVRALTPLEERILAPSADAVVVESVPAGATLKVDGRPVGMTPWAGDNVWQGEVKVVIEKEGFAPWEGTLAGGKEAEIKATLKRK